MKKSIYFGISSAPFDMCYNYMMIAHSRQNSKVCLLMLVNALL